MGYIKKIQYLGNSAPEEKEEKHGTETIFEEIITEEKHQETEERHQIKRLFEPQTEFKEENLPTKKIPRPDGFQIK